MAGAGVGATVITLGVLGVRLLAGDGAGEAPHLLLQGGVLLGVATAAFTGWRLARTLPDGWRRGLTAALAAFAGLLLAALTVPADLLAGPIGLAAFALATAALSATAARRARHAAR